MDTLQESYVVLDRRDYPEDVANLVLFYASKDSDYITGQNKFTKLKSLTLLDSPEHPVPSVRFSERMNLYQTLERLTLHEIREGDDFSPYRCGCSHGDHHGTQDVEFEFDYLPEEEKSLSNLETLIIGNIPDENRTWTSTQISFHVLTKELLPRLPKLNKLMINAVHFDQNRSLQLIGMHQSTTHNDADIRLNLKTIKIWTRTDRRKGYADERSLKLLKKFFLNINSSDTTIQTFCINNETVLS
ncbi:hypothetical protein I4U23_016398 [Adineta vaga]|nr:hypothetical protein I4U23_016398 [Adineta vaga]